MQELLSMIKSLHEVPESIHLTGHQVKWLENMVVAYMMTAEGRQEVGDKVTNLALTKLDSLWDEVIVKEKI